MTINNVVVIGNSSLA